MGCIKLKSFYTAKGTITEGEKLFASDSPNRGLIFRIYKELKKVKHQNNKSTSQ
jgi:hypothetical protein